ncbi:MAG: SPOR domain-containing protein, partial [Spirochaetaceae bacterium]|nr:SPOR domain-containing protein [Spirochaetaceae bacterium]
MALTRPAAALLFLFLLAGHRIFPQPVPLAAEMEGLEKQLAGSKLSSGERKTALVRRARLLELSGNFESAAAAWKEAALAGDAGALLREARCLAALGEFEKAQEELRTGSRASAEAGLLFSQLEALRTGRTGALGALLADPEFSSYKPGIYYSIWKISGDLSVRNRLIGEFPQSPEARIVKGSDGA